MITVMFSSLNRSAIVKMTLDSFARMRPPAERWKLVTVDNGSTDATAAVMRSYADRLPITVLTEPAPGKNRALNQALAQAEGDLFIFCDDDILVCEDWLSRWREVADGHRDFELFAGLTEAHWPCEPPQWIFDDIDSSLAFSLNNYAPEGPCDVTDMHGTNMAIRAEVFKSGIQFDTTIGPDGTANYAMGSETELNRRLEGMGLKCWFARGPYVEHIIRPEQFEAEWLVRRAYRWGRGLPRLGLPYHSPYKKVALKNNLKSLFFPVMAPFLTTRGCIQRLWFWMADRGYEDGVREMAGLKPRWRNEKGPIITPSFLSKIKADPMMAHADAGHASSESPA